MLDLTKKMMPMCYSGGTINLLDPKPEDIKIEDLAHPLAMLCRYTGACSKFYSVAQHSVFVALQCEARKATREETLWGLLHDAAEAYIGDLSRPMRRFLQHSGNHAFEYIEKEILKAVALKFNLPEKIPDIVWKMDEAEWKREWRVLMPNPEVVGLTKPEIWESLECWPWARAENEFLHLFNRLS